jgi:hypothetical protein
MNHLLPHRQASYCASLVNEGLRTAAKQSETARLRASEDAQFQSAGSGETP